MAGDMTGAAGSGLSADLITPDGIRRAYDTIRPYLRRTPVVQVDPGALAGTGPGTARPAVSLKLEQLQCSGSFKVRGVRVAPQRLGQLVAGDVAVAVDDQVGEQQPVLAAGQPGVQPLAVALDGQRPADLDPHRARGRQGHASILAVCCGERLGGEARWRS